MFHRSINWIFLSQKLENWFAFKIKSVGDKNLRDLSNKGDMSVLLTCNRWACYSKILLKKLLHTLLCLPLEKSCFIKRVSRIINKALFYRSCYSMFASYEFKLFNKYSTIPSLHLWLFFLLLQHSFFMKI